MEGVRGAEKKMSCKQKIVDQQTFQLYICSQKGGTRAMAAKKKATKKASAKKTTKKKGKK